MASSRNSRSVDAFSAALRDAVDRHRLAGSRVVVALSGGRDSVALLHGLAQRRDAFDLRLAAHHVNHGLSVNAGRWQQFCADLCAGLEVPFTAQRIEVARDGGDGVEAAARAARYASFAGLDAEWVALAHHRGDQAETVLHNLLRGAGVRGLAGMPVERQIEAGRARLIRPLLGVPRDAIEAYLLAHALTWIDDESNLDSGYTRNWLRRDILPALMRRFPAVDAALARSAAQAAEAESMLDALGALDLEATAPGGRLQIVAFRELDAARGRNLLRHLLRKAGESMPDAARLADLQRQLCDIDRDSEFDFPLDRVELRAFAGELYILERPVATQPSWNGDLRLPWAGEPQLDWPAGRVTFKKAVGQGFAADRVGGSTCHLATRQGGESLQPDARRPRRSLKHWYQELGVPPWERERRPLLWCGDALVWVAGIGIDAAFLCGEGMPGWVPHWEPDA